MKASSNFACGAKPVEIEKMQIINVQDCSHVPYIQILNFRTFGCNSE